MSGEEKPRTNSETVDLYGTKAADPVASRTRSSAQNKALQSTDNVATEKNGNGSSDTKTANSLPSKLDVSDDNTKPEEQNEDPNRSGSEQGRKGHYHNGKHQVEQKINDTGNKDHSEQRNLAPRHDGKDECEHSDTENGTVLQDDGGETSIDRGDKMSRRPLYTNTNSKKSPTLSPKASPGSPRHKKKPKSPSIKQSPELSEDESDVEEDKESENGVEDKNNSARVKPVRKQENLYPDLTQEKEKQKKEKSTKKGKDSKKASHESEKPSFDDRPDGRKKEEGSNLLIIAIFVVLLGCFVAYNMLSSNESKDSKTQNFDNYKVFKEDFSKLQSEFPDQSGRFWKVIGSQIRRILTEESPTYPAIILVGVPYNRQELGACFTKKVVRMVNRVMNASGDFYVNTKNLDGSSPDKTKLELDQRMHTALQSSKSVILDHIETLPGKAALLLHAYCDGDNAPYKKAVIFLNLHPSKEFPDAELLQDSFVEDMLVNLWQADLGQDEMPALQARIANNIAVMKTEKGKNVCS